MQDPTKAIAESYAKQALFEQFALSNTSAIVEAICEFEYSNDVELTEEQIKIVVERFLTELHG